MSSALSMNTRKCVHAQKAKSPTQLRQSRMNQARSEEEEKERKKDGKNRGQKADVKKGSQKKKKHIGETKTRHT